MLVEKAVLVQQRHVDELRRDVPERNENAVTIVLGQPEAQETTVTIEVAGGKARLIQKVRLGNERESEQAHEHGKGTETQNGSCPAHERQSVTVI